MHMFCDKNVLVQNISTTASWRRENDEGECNDQIVAVVDSSISFVSQDENWNHRNITHVCQLEYINATYFYQLSVPYDGHTNYFKMLYV